VRQGGAMLELPFHDRADAFNLLIKSQRENTCQYFWRGERVRLWTLSSFRAVKDSRDLARNIGHGSPLCAKPHRAGWAAQVTVIRNSPRHRESIKV
jgi:hypothetical protein